MGMSHDFEQSIRAGSNEVRVGSAIFGERNYEGTTSAASSTHATHTSLTAAYAASKLASVLSPSSFFSSSPSPSLSSFSSPLSASSSSSPSVAPVHASEVDAGSPSVYAAPHASACISTSWCTDDRHDDGPVPSSWILNAHQLLLLSLCLCCSSFAQPLPLFRDVFIDYRHDDDPDRENTVLCDRCRDRER